MDTKKSRSLSPRISVKSIKEFGFHDGMMYAIFIIVLSSLC